METKKRIPTFEGFLLESSTKGIIYDILLALEDDIQSLINKYEEVFQKTYERPMSQYDKEHARLIITFDMIKSIEVYTLPTDILVSISSSVSHKGNLEISAIINRDGQNFNLNTEVIYVGGYNIVRLHYRYITKTNLPKTNSNKLTNEYSEKIKKLSKLEKMNKEIESYRNRIKYNDEKIATNSKLSDEEIFDLLLKEDNYNYLTVTWDEIVRRGADKNYGGENDFKSKQQESINDAIDFWKTKNIRWTIENNMALKKSLSKLETKLSQLIDG